LKARLRRIALWTARATAVLVAVLAVAVTALWATTDLDRARFVRPDDAVSITDRHGVPLRYHRPDGEDRRWVELSAISPHLIDAILAVEDSRFREHEGVDVRATVRALFTWALPDRRTSGASTITQQLVKRVYGRPHGLWSKPREVVRAVLLEERFDKDWILEQYLNRVPYGEPIVGVARASELYFGKPVSELSVAEAALLAGIPQAPSALDPRRHPAAARRRQRFVLSRMRDTGRIDEATYQRALREPLRLHAREVRPFRAARFADAALRELREGRLERRGGEVRTSLDLELQREAERVLRAAVDRHASRGVTNGAAIVVAHETGEILAYVGAARSGEAPGGWLDLVRARRQPGSTLKPFVYELFFERGGTAASVLDDLSRPMTGHDGVLFAARDYDGRERGPVRARVALSGSLNLAALDAARQVGAERIVRRLGQLGFAELSDAGRYGPAIVLGGADVQPLELASAYVTLARGGTRVPLAYGPVAAAPTPRRVMDAGAARVTCDVLEDPLARREAFGDDLRGLFRDAPFGLKTGTSSGWRDAWAAVFTDTFTVVVWLGDPAGRPLGGLSGFEGAARPAVELLAGAHGRRDELGLRAVRRDAPLAPARVCAFTGLRPGARCTHTVEERFAQGTLPTRTCEAHRDDGAVELPPRYAAWLSAAQPAGYALRATERDGVPRVEHPRDGARLMIDPTRASALPLRASVGGAPVDARFEVDGAPVEGARWVPTAGSHSVVAIVGDRRSAPVTVHVELGR
jgi:penicillin-binding protein 1C